MKAAPKKTVVPKEPKLHNHCSPLTLAEIESFPLVGIHQNNWQRRNIRLYQNQLAEAEGCVYSVGRFEDGSAIVVSYDKLADCMNFRIAVDYWQHGNKVYTRD